MGLVCDKLSHTAVVCEDVLVDCCCVWLLRPRFYWALSNWVFVWIKLIQIFGLEPILLDLTTQICV